MTANESNKVDDTREVTALRSAALRGDDAPSPVLLAPWGQVESTNGSFIVDEESAGFAVAAFTEHGTDLPIDYEHQTLGGAYSSPSGQAPAAGWIKRIFAQPGVGLLAEIEWTEQAKQMLASRQYRYLSPVAIIRKTNRKLVAIHSAALTNKPAIVGMQPIVSRAEVPASPPEAEEPLVRLRVELDLPADADADEVLVAASQKIVDLAEEAKRRHAQQRIHEATRAGKLVEAQRGWAEALVAREEGLFDEWLRSAPIVVSLGAVTASPLRDATDRSQQAIAARARSEFTDNALLLGLTTEEAYVSDALRQAGRSPRSAA